MTYAASIALMSAGIACYVAVLSRQFSKAPGWHDQRYFSLAALSVAGFAALNVPTTAPVLSDAGMVLCSRIQFALASLHSFAWLRYSGVVVGRPVSRVERTFTWALVLMAVLAAFTNAFLTGAVRSHAFEPLSVVYRSPAMTVVGDVAYAVVVGALLVPVARFARAWRRGVPNAAVQFLALAFLLVMAANDVLVLSGVYSAPYLVDVAFLLPVAAVGFVLTSRFVEDSRAHRALRDDLERQVADRTIELGRAQEALHRAEKLAALGQFAAGVAHEVNNPASVIAANLAYVEQTERGTLSDDGHDAVKESIQSVQRIATIVRQLLDAGRLAASPEARSAVALKPLGDGAISVARARFGKRVRVTNAVPGDAYASGNEAMLAQVLVNLVANGVQAIPDHRSDGHVMVRAETREDRVELVVEDNGSGIAPDVLRRVFEPFFTTKPFGSGTGLGLAVSRGLIMSLGGDLRLESTLGVGTRATIELARAHGIGRERASGLDPQPAIPRRRVLVVDDDAAVLSSLRRLLALRYHVETASGVEDALVRIETQPFDLVLCDVMMPGGGGERLYTTLALRSPAAARRVVFFTGGTVTESARQFLHNQSQPVLYKPLDLEELARIARSMCGETGAGYGVTH